MTISEQVFETGEFSKSIEIGNKDISKCTVTCNADWCFVIIRESSINVSVSSNDSYEDRKAVITITDPEDATTLSFIVVQKQNDVIFVDESTFNVPEEGGIVTVKVESNVDYEVELPAEGWITILNGTRGLKKSELSLKVAINNSGNVRKGIVKIVNKGTGSYENIIIKQNLVPRVEINPKNISVDEHGDEITVKVRSNVIIANIATDENWITIGKKKDIDGFNFSVKLKILPMSNQNERSGIVAFESSNGSFLSLLSVNQKFNEILSVDKTSISADYKGGDFYLTVTTNAGYSMTNTGWIQMHRLSYDQFNYGTIHEVPYKFTIEPNDSENERNGTIRIIGKTKEITVQVYQSGNPNTPNTPDIFDITKLVTCYTKVVYYASGLFGSTEAYARIDNNSPYNIYLTKVMMYTSYNGTILVHYLDSQILAPGRYQNVYLDTHVPSLDTKGLECKWTFIYDGKEYTVTGRGK